jgi:formate hydrogenlyase subunit 6/NADH:ubiquinone oxidoreductase subunit I
MEKYPVPIIDIKRCVVCTLCVHYCPGGTLAVKNGTIVIANPQACQYRGYCEQLCPTYAISRPFEIIFSPREEA